MKVSRADVERNRKLILAAAARLFRERGFDGVNVSQIMKEAGLTHGAFYGYFESKEMLIGQVLDSILSPQVGASNEIPEDFEVYASAYLSVKHRDDPAGGCPYAALGSELVRAPKSVRKLLTKAIARRIETLSASTAGKTTERRRRAAIAGWSSMIGAVTLSRIVDDPKLSNEILKSARASIKD
jgi:TetR/AcrR family transcriptional repressor of nem operon